MIGFRHAPPRYPFFWEECIQPPARWHSAGEGPVQYLADSADGAWAELIRHEEISDPEDLADIRRALWMVDLGRPDVTEMVLDTDSVLPIEDQQGGIDTYPACQEAARTARGTGTSVVFAHSAALQAGEVRGMTTNGGLQPAGPRDGGVFVYFGARPDLVGWQLCSEGRPGMRVLLHTRPLS